MNTDRLEIKKAEFQELEKEYLKNPELFKEQTYIDDAKTLLELGIQIPGKEEFPHGYIKFWPEDFIVEEKINGTVKSVFATEEKAPTHSAGTYYATLVKCNLSTFEAAEDLAKQLRIRTEDISFAGLKDKSALTAQKISIRHASPEALKNISSPYYFLAEWELGKGSMQRGYLEGNKFTILVRTRQDFFNPESFAQFANKLQEVKENGFYNFFYLQRFGVARLRNYQWALSILRGNYEEAVLDFLTYQGPREIPFFKDIRKSLQKNIPNWNVVYEDLLRFPLIFENELRVVQHLKNHPGDYRGALQTLPEQITFWLYALSSLFFNAKISELILNNKPVPKALPFFLSPLRADQQIYSSILDPIGFSPSQFENLRPFPQIIIKNRSTPTRSHVDFKKAEIVPEGIIFEFDLGKGQYATTMLSHMFTLASGLPPDFISNTFVDSKKVLSEHAIGHLLDRFGEVIHSKNEKYLFQVGD